MKNVVIIYGAKSCEHDISIITACLARGYFANHCVYGVYLDKDDVAYLIPNDYTPAAHVKESFKNKVVFLTGERALGIMRRNRICKKINIDVAVNCCHGAHGEDGTAAAICGLLNVPFVGSGITSSAIAMDKILTKRVLQSLDMPVVNGFEADVQTAEQLEELSKGYKFPLIVKPNTLGSSIGVELCRNLDELTEGVYRALKYDGRVLVEEALTDFTELNCAAMRTCNAAVVSRVDVPVTANDLLTFEDKYIESSAESAENNGNKISRLITEQVQALTRSIYEKLGYGGVIRVDYLYDNVTDKLYVNEINSIPGSLAYGLFSDRYAILQYGDMLIKQAEEDYAKTAMLTTTFNSSVLSGGTGAKRRKK